MVHSAAEMWAGSDGGDEAGEKGVGEAEFHERKVGGGNDTGDGEQEITRRERKTEEQRWGLSPVGEDDIAGLEAVQTVTFWRAETCRKCPGRSIPE